MNRKTPENDLRNWIEGCFPQIVKRIPRKPFFIDFGNVKLLSSHNIPDLYDFINSSGYIPFLKSKEVPDGFFACGIKSPAVSESVLIMWKEGNRLFWFNDQYALYIARSGDSIIETRSNLDEAIQLWKSGKQHVFSLLGQFFDHDEELIQRAIRWIMGEDDPK
jgi:hypothetical protein